MLTPYLVVSNVFNDVKQVRAGILSVWIEFQLSLSAIRASASEDSASLSSFLVKS